MKKPLITRRNFLTKSTGLGLGLGLLNSTAISLISTGCAGNHGNQQVSSFKKGEKQLFADDVMISRLLDISRKSHAASKLERPVLEAEMPWERRKTHAASKLGRPVLEAEVPLEPGDEFNDERDRRIYIYGTVLRDQETGSFRMWYNRYRKNYYATSFDGINWQRPELGLLGKNNMIELYDFHSPSFILDEWDTDTSKRYKAIGSTKAGYYAAYSADGLKWNLYPKNPVLLSSDTITLAQDPVNHEYLAFHKTSRDPRVKGRQVFLSVSNNMQKWSDPEPVMVTDEIDHQQARLLKGGTHSEFYNMSAFPYGNQWLGLVTHFRLTGEPPIKKGPMQSMADGPIDIQLVHSRDGRKWERCSDRSPVIPLGPYRYDSGSILGLCNSPVIVDNEMWMYYTAMTTTHGGYLPDKEMSIARASWRLDGMVSLNAGKTGGIIETVPFLPEGNKLVVNADASRGKLMVEVLDINGKVKKGFEKESCEVSGKNSVKIPVKWKSNEQLPQGKPISLRFYLEHGDLYSYTID